MNTSFCRACTNLKQVLRTSISETNASWQTFTPFTDTSFINDCLLLPRLHVNHPLLQFADITDPLLRTSALFLRFYSHMIQTWASKAASHIAKWFGGISHALSIETGSNCNFQVSQGSAETYSRCDGESFRYVYKFSSGIWLKNIWKLVYICQSYNQKSSVLFFEAWCTWRYICSLKENQPFNQCDMAC